LDYEALEGLQALAAKLQILVVVITHVRKATADDVFDTVSGTLGLTAAADTILVLGPKNGLMTLCVRGRDVEESEKTVRFDKGHVAGRSLVTRLRTRRGLMPAAACWRH
jgi:hypothetical protein